MPEHQPRDATRIEASNSLGIEVISSETQGRWFSSRKEKVLKFELAYLDVALCYTRAPYNALTL